MRNPRISETEAGVSLSVSDQPVLLRECQANPRLHNETLSTKQKLRLEAQCRDQVLTSVPEAAGSTQHYTFIGKFKRLKQQ